MNFLTGYKTYIVAGLMGAIALASVGLELVSPDTLSGTVEVYLHDLMEALAIIFLRKGISRPKFDV